MTYILIALLILISLVCHIYSLPINVLDIVLNTLCLFLVYGLYAGRKDYRKYINETAILNLSPLKFTGIAFFFFLLLLTFSGVAYIGYEGLFVLNHSVRGSVHGYTALILGSVVCMYLLLGLYLMFKVRKA